LTVLKLRLTLLLFLLIPLTISADDDTNEDEDTLYQTADERRESEFGIELNERVTLTGSLEFEKENLTLHFDDGTRSVENEDPAQTLQLGFEVGISDNVGIELVFEGESSDRIRGEVDEGFIHAEFENLTLQLGRQDLPFGEYYSYFVADPLLQFGETKADALVADYGFAEFLAISPFVFESNVSKELDNDSVDWGAVLSFTNKDESIRIGAGYISDLAESDEQLLFDFGNRFQQRVSAVSAHVLMGFEQIEVTAEWIEANKKFREFDLEFDKPSSYNLELAYFPTERVVIATRLERSRELEDTQEERYGIALTWFVSKYVSISLDYLTGRFKRFHIVLDEEDEDEEIELTPHRSREMGLLLEFEF